MTASAAIGLRCIRCRSDYAFDPRAYLCPACGEGGPGADPGILDVQYDYDCARTLWKGATAVDSEALFRFLPLLPVAGAAPVLRTGDTALIPAPRLARRLGLRAIYLKDETRQPTRCLKDRATAVGMALALNQGASTVYCASAGNAAISLAGFAAHLGLACHVFVPQGVSEVRLDWLRRYGAQVHISEGNYDRAFEESEVAGKANGWYSRNCAYNPFLVEGKKTVAFEIAEQLGRNMPDLVVAPVGDGCTLAAIGKGFRELRALDPQSARPRLLGVQAEAVQPLVERRHGRSSPSAPMVTRAASISVQHPRNARRLLEEIGAAGDLLAVSDEEIEAAQADLAREAGMVAEFTSAATLAALCRRAGELQGGVAVLVITGGRAD